MARTKKADKALKEKQARKAALALAEMPDDGWDENDTGHNNYIKRDKRGRPTVMTKQVLEKLRSAFSIGCPDSEACIWAGIDTKTLWNYCQKNKDFSIEKEELKQKPVLVSRNTIYKAIQTNPDDAKWYLTRKRKKEFAELKIDSSLDEAISTDELEQLNRGDIKLIK